ncbi:hypothetical protein EB796_009606 [Bugula neritina]|uniref:Cyclic nucleotide-binding domain-containing protein n=1 Tax=Bugula neritina TaxID=10212 RepID=A0A7J7K3G1_BUGNE|nr:hypothetical protein EB796_009606 [Bugula neritina]
MATILEEIENMVSKPPNQRTEEELNRLLPWFRKKSEVFNSLKPDAVADIVRNCKLIRRAKDNVIIKQGEKGNCFFIILSGKVSVHISAKDDDDVDEEHRNEAELTHALGLPYKKQPNDRINTVFLNKTTGGTSSPKNMNDEKAYKNLEMGSEFIVEAFQRPNTQVMDRAKYGQYVATIADGKSFGELALLKRDCIRNATIITDTNTRMLVVNRQLYNRCIKESQEKEFQAKQLFVHTSEYFEGWSLKSKRHCYQGQPLDCIYFLQSGQCRVIINPSLHYKQYPSYRRWTNLVLSHSAQPINEEYVPPQVVRRGRKNGYALQGFDICLIGSLNMIGDIELANGLPTYMQTVICEQQTEAFAIDLRNYDRLVTRRHAFTGRLIAQNALLKLSNRAVRFTHIPLLSAIVKKCNSQPQDYRHKQLYATYQRIDTARFHQREERIKNKLEAKILAFHEDVEKEKAKNLIKS